VHGGDIWTLRERDQKYLGRFYTWCWRMMEKVSWTDRERNEEILQSQGEEEYPKYNISKEN
jgi:hypothetical protein